MLVSELKRTSNNLIIIGSGPSALRMLPGLEGSDTLLINRPLIENPTFWMVLDQDVARKYRVEIGATKATVIFGSMSFTRCAKYYFTNQQYGIGWNLNFPFVGGSSVYASLQLAVRMGYDSIHVYGCDQTAEQGSLYASGEEPLVADRELRFEKEAQAFEWLRTHLDQETKNKIHFHSDINTRNWFINWQK